MGKLIDEVIPEHLSKIDSNWFLSVKSEFDNLPFLDSDGNVSYYEDLSSTESHWDEENQEPVDEYEERIIELDFYFPTFISNRFKIYSTLDYIFDNGLEDIDNYPAYRDQERTISGSQIINVLFDQIIQIGDKVPIDNLEKFLNQVLGALDIGINCLKETYDDDIYHDSLDSLNKWLQDRILSRYRKDLEVSAYFSMDSNSKLNLELNQSQLSALAFIFLKADFINSTERKKLLRIFSEEFRVKDGPSYKDVSISQLEKQLGKVSGPSNESSGLKEIVTRIEALFKATKSKS